MHARGRIQHGFVHVDVDDLRTTLDLLTRHGNRFVVFFFANQTGEHFAARDVGALTYVDKQGLTVDIERLESRQTGLDGDLWNDAHRQATYFVRDGLDMLGSRTATASRNVDQTRPRKLLEQRRGICRRFVETCFTHRIGQARIRIHTHIGVTNLG